MDTPTERIRVTEAVVREIERRRRDGESDNDVLERVLSDDRDLLFGAGFWSNETAERVREGRRAAKAKSQDRQ